MTSEAIQLCVMNWSKWFTDNLLLHWAVNSCSRITESLNWRKPDHWMNHSDWGLWTRFIDSEGWFTNMASLFLTWTLMNVAWEPNVSIFSEKLLVGSWNIVHKLCFIYCFQVVFLVQFYYIGPRDWDSIQKFNFCISQEKKVIRVFNDMSEFTFFWVNSSFKTVIE